jgi:hypothetical protein
MSRLAPPSASTLHSNERRPNVVQITPVCTLVNGPSRGNPGHACKHARNLPFVTMGRKLCLPLWLRALKGDQMPNFLIRWVAVYFMWLPCCGSGRDPWRTLLMPGCELSFLAQCHGCSLAQRPEAFESDESQCFSMLKLYECLGHELGTDSEYAANLRLMAPQTTP